MNVQFLSHIIESLFNKKDESGFFGIYYLLLNDPANN